MPGPPSINVNPPMQQRQSALNIQDPFVIQILREIMQRRVALMGGRSPGMQLYQNSLAPQGGGGNTYPGYDFTQGPKQLPLMVGDVADATSRSGLWTGRPG